MHIFRDQEIVVEARFWRHKSCLQGRRSVARFVQGKWNSARGTPILIRKAQRRIAIILNVTALNAIRTVFVARDKIRNKNVGSSYRSCPLFVFFMSWFHKPCNDTCHGIPRSMRRHVSWHATSHALRRDAVRGHRVPQNMPRHAVGCCEMPWDARE